MMSKKYYLLLLAAFALAACDPKREISPEEQREIYAEFIANCGSCHRELGKKVD